MKPRARQAALAPAAEAESHTGVLENARGPLREAVPEQRTSEKCADARETGQSAPDRVLEGTVALPVKYKIRGA